MAGRHENAINGMIFDFPGTGSVVFDCDWWNNFFKIEIVFLSRDLSSLQNNVYHLNQKWFLSLLVP